MKHQEPIIVAVIGYALCIIYGHLIWPYFDRYNFVLALVAMTGFVGRRVGLLIGEHYETLRSHTQEQESLHRKTLLG